MPNSRRRKFSVKNNNPRRVTAKGATSETNSNVSSHSPTKPYNNRNKLFRYSSSSIEPMEKVEECNENSSISLAKTNSNHGLICSSQVASSSKSLDSHRAAKQISESVELSNQPEHEVQPQTSKDTRSREKNRPKPHQHCARIRSPKTPLVIMETTKIEIKEQVETTGADLHLSKAESHIETVGTNTELTEATPVHNTNVLADLQIRSLDDMCRVCHNLDLTKLIRPSACSYQESDLKNHLLTLEAINIETYTDARDGIETCLETISTNTDLPQVPVYNTNICFEMDRFSDHSLDDMCRICHGGDMSELGRLISACNCRGTVGRVHVRCLERWLTESGKSRCELCGVRYTTRRVHRYGVIRALVMWFLSQNAKQLMVDSLGIMLMSPLAVLAAWLSGRTLAGLMTQESQVTPWPLASTFVLACMTLVCYYCWIVSAATRHALGWWIWYRSQYEVRLQIQDEE